MMHNKSAQNGQCSKETRVDVNYEWHEAKDIIRGTLKEKIGCQEKQN